MDPTKTFRRTCLARPKEVRKLLVAFERFLSGTCGHSRPFGNLQIVTAEALNNVAEHAYAQENAGPVSLFCIVRAHGFFCRIEDRGRPLDHIPSICPPNISKELPEGGFGWFLIHQLASQIRYQRSGEHNILSFVVLRHLEEIENAPKAPQSFRIDAGKQDHT